MPLNAESKLGNGATATRPSTLIEKLNYEFELLETQLQEQKFTAAYTPEMQSILAVWKAWLRPGDKQSWLIPQEKFEASFLAYCHQYNSTQSTHVREKGNGLVPESADVSDYVFHRHHEPAETGQIKAHGHGQARMTALLADLKKL